MGDREGAPLLVAPEGFVVERDERAAPAFDYRTAEARSETLRVAWPSGPRSKGVALLVFCVFWFGFLAFWYTTAFSGNAPWIVFVFPLLHVGAGLGMLYGALLALLNTTRLELGSGVLEVRGGPVPVRGNVRLDAARIRQLFVTRKEVQSRRGGKTTTYALEAIVDGDRRVVVVRELEEASGGLYLEALLEQTLGIEPQPVVGEIAR